MAKIVTYEFAANDPDIALLKSRFGDELDQFSSNYEREHRPGAIYGFGSFELLPKLAEDPTWVKEYWGELFDFLRIINSRWSESNRDQIINRSVFSLDQLEQYNVSNDFKAAVKEFHGVSDEVNKFFSSERSYSNRDLLVPMHRLRKAFVKFVEIGDEQGAFTTICQVDSGCTVSGYHFTAGFFLFVLAELYNQTAIERKFILQTPFFYFVTTYALCSKGKAEKGEQYLYSTKEMPSSVDQFVLQKIAGGQNTKKLANFFRDTYIKAWAYKVIQKSTKEGKSITQKALVFSLKEEYQKLTALLPESMRMQLSVEEIEGEAGSTYSRILKKIREPSYLKCEAIRLGMLDLFFPPSEELVQQQLGAPSNPEEAEMQRRMSEFLFR